MFHMHNVMTGEELREAQQVFDKIVARHWFVRNQAYELELASYLIHLYSYGVRDANVLYEMCARAALRRRAAAVG